MSSYLKRTTKMRTWLRTELAKAVGANPDKIRGYIILIEDDLGTHITSSLRNADLIVMALLETASEINQLLIRKDENVSVNQEGSKIS